MKRAAIRFAALFFCASAAAAMEISELPEVLAHLNDIPIKRGDVAASLAPRIVGYDEPCEDVRRAVRRAVDDEICRRLLDDMLKEEHIRPSREIALEYIAGILRDIPPMRRAELERELLPQAQHADFQLKAAVHFYLLRRCDPELLRVSAAEMERYYYLNLPRYRTPEHLDVGVIRIDRKRKDAASVAATARARLLQGESFDRVASELDPEGGERTSPEELRSLFSGALERLQPGDVSEVIDASDAFYVLLLRKRDPGREMLPEEVGGYIRLELSSAKDSLALRELLLRRMAGCRIVYTDIAAPQDGR